jgi:hypothetical protein
VRYRTGPDANLLITARPMQGYAGKSFQIDDAGKLTEIK